MKFIKNDTGFDINDSNVKYIHLHWDRLLSNLGGATICYYLDFETKHIYFNYSNCASGDNFNKRIGRNIALGRLRQNYVQVSLEKEIKYKNCCEAIENYFLKYTKDHPEFESFHNRFSLDILMMFISRKNEYGNPSVHKLDRYDPFTYFD